MLLGATTTFVPMLSIAPGMRVCQSNVGVGWGVQTGGCRRGAWGSMVPRPLRRATRGVKAFCGRVGCGAPGPMGRGVFDGAALLCGHNPLPADGRATTGGGENWEHAKLGIAKFGAEKIWHQFSDTTAKFCTKLADCGTTTSIDREWWLLFPTGLWLLAVIPWRPLDGCLDGCPYFLEVVGHNGDVHGKRAKNDS